ncbi:hypothetical protein [Inquilinus sp. OTU3971]|uniref:hypothetical protein n=1 Tax=Inquilinus sp. OTU3971 TaxID=3043855 RepID=UPI00313F2559
MALLVDGKGDVYQPDGARHLKKLELDAGEREFVQSKVAALAQSRGTTPDALFSEGNHVGLLEEALEDPAAGKRHDSMWQGAVDIGYTPSQAADLEALNRQVADPHKMQEYDAFLLPQGLSPELLSGASADEAQPQSPTSKYLTAAEAGEGLKNTLAPVVGAGEPTQEQVAGLIRPDAEAFLNAAPSAEERKIRRDALLQVDYGVQFRQSDRPKADHINGAVRSVLLDIDFDAVKRSGGDPMTVLEEIFGTLNTSYPDPADRENIWQIAKTSGLARGVDPSAIGYLERH